MSVKSLLNKEEVLDLYLEHRSLRVVSRVLSEGGQMSPRTGRPYTAMALHFVLMNFPRYQELMVMRRASKVEKPTFKGKLIKMPRHLNLGTPS